MDNHLHNTTQRISACFPDLAGKKAIVTGASRGIGQGIAEFLGRQGMKLILTARSEEAGQVFTRELNVSGIEAHCGWRQPGECAFSAGGEWGTTGRAISRKERKLQEGR